MEAHEPPPRPGRTPPAPSPVAQFVARLVAVGALVAVIVVLAVIVLGSGGHGASAPSTSSNAASATTTHSRTTPLPAKLAAVPILTYNVVNTQPPASTLPASLYVPVADFTAQMQALKSAGWHPVTLDALGAYWSGKGTLPAKPLVITFDGGYASQAANALPVLKSLGWVAVADLPQNLLPSSEGGLSSAQVQALHAAGWELDALTPTQPDLTAASATSAQQTLSSLRQALSTTYGVPVNWVAYSLGRYNATVSAAARAAGFAGALTGVAGWANPTGNRYALARIVVAGGTSAQQLQSQISSDQSAAAPSASGG